MNENIKIVPCISCEKPIKVGAHLCFHCRAEQSPNSGLAPIVKTAGKVALVLTLILAVGKVYDIWSQHRVAVQNHKKQINTAEILFKAKDFATAWDILTIVQREDPGSTIVLKNVLDIAAAWLLESFEIQQGWHGRSRHTEQQSKPVLDAEQVAKKVHPALVVSSVYAHDEERANLQALIIYTRILRATTDLRMRRNYSAELTSIIQQAPNAYYGNLIRGYWQLVFDKNLPAALDSWKIALANGQNSSLVRHFQVSILGSIIQRLKYRENDDYRRQLLLVLDEMHDNHEELPNALTVDVYTSIYYKNNSWDKESFDVVYSMLDIENQLTILNWVKEDTVDKWNKANMGNAKYFYFITSGFEYIRARLQEQHDDRDAALQTISRLDLKEISSKILQKRFDDIIYRITGKLPPDLIDRNPWEVHLYNLKNEPPESESFQKAIEALQEKQRLWHAHGLQPPVELLAALDNAIISLGKWMQQPTFSETQRSEVKLMYTEFRVFRGTVLATRTNVHKGIGELESLSIDPQIPQNLRAKILFYLAKAYQSTYMITLDIGFIRTKTQQKVAFAYFDEAMSRLEAALLAGFNNWKLIEKDLSKLRSVYPEYYSKLSLKYGRVPPREE